MNILTMKFGGTSVGSIEAIDQATSIIVEASQQWDAVAVIVSAMSGVTDSLIQGAETAASGDDHTYKQIAESLIQKHNEVIEALTLSGEQKALKALVKNFMDEFSELCHGIMLLEEVTPRALDTIVSFGERMNAPIISAVLRKKGIRSKAVPALELIVTDSTYQNAVPQMEETRTKTRAVLLPLLEEKIVPVITGFIGATPKGNVTTLGRGGSDYSAAIIGTCLDSTEVWIWTDVDGVMTTDPRIVKDARVIPVLSASEISELAYFGAKVLHPRTIWPVIERNIPLWVKNTFNPKFPGTKIVKGSDSTNGGVKAVTVIRNLSLVTVEGHGMMGVPGIAARTFSAVARQKANVLMISQASSEQSICFIVPTQTVPNVVKALEEEFAIELRRGDINRVWNLDNVVIVTVVGTGLRRTPGLAAKIFGALGDAQINIIAIAQGSSEYSISVVISSKHADTAVREIHSKVLSQTQ
ncbi:MAG TPA: aspartate kinase, monofunctional class [Bacteroidota bacterium]|nr:aspartate kinase, monofunctional class [Bacteroidota bacterium]